MGGNKLPERHTCRRGTAEVREERECDDGDGSALAIVPDRGARGLLPGPESDGDRCTVVREACTASPFVHRHW